MNKRQAQATMTTEIKNAIHKLDFDEIKEIYEIVERRSYETADDKERERIYELNQALLGVAEVAPDNK